MRIIALIPARLQSTRLAQKLLLPLGNSTVIGMTYQNVLQSGVFDEVYVVTDNDEIAQHIDNLNGLVLRNQKSHDSGTDRIAEFVDLFNDDDILVNVQGDEPFIQKANLELLIEIMKMHNEPKRIGTLMHALDDSTAIENPNNVKVVRSHDGRALYFSRLPIPYRRDIDMTCTYYKHIGIYAFTPAALRTFTQAEPSTLEKIEKLENLRFLELNIPVYIEETPHQTIGIDTQEDWEKAVLHFKKL